MPGTGLLRVLVVDDEPDVALLVVDLLEAEGYQVDVAPNGRAALDQIASAPYDVVMADVHMPEMDGPELYEALRERHPALLGRFVLITGELPGDRVGVFLARTGVPYLTKPFQFAHVIDTVRRVAAAPA